MVQGGYGRRRGIFIFFSSFSYFLFDLLTFSSRCMSDTVICLEFLAGVGFVYQSCMILDMGRIVSLDYLVSRGGYSIKS